MCPRKGADPRRQDPVACRSPTVRKPRLGRDATTTILDHDRIAVRGNHLLEDEGRPASIRRIGSKQDAAPRAGAKRSPSAIRTEWCDTSSATTFAGSGRTTTCRKACGKGICHRLAWATEGRSLELRGKPCSICRRMILGSGRRRLSRRLEPPPSYRNRPLTATTLLIIRHGEKPDLPGDGPGLTAEGGSDPQSLVIRGWQRAGAWAALFAFDTPACPRPRVVYAAGPAVGADGDQPSRRPFKTASPVAARLGLKVRTAWALGQEAKLAAEATATSGTILICSKHRRIMSALLPAILGDQDPPGLPARWNGHRFDIVLRLDMISPDAPWRYQQSSPCLMAGDSASLV